MKEKLLFLLPVLVLSVASCQPKAKGDFGIYLLAEDGPASRLAEADLKDIALQDQPVIGLDDIVAYDNQNHEIQLTAAAYGRVQELFPLPVRVDGIPFVVRAGNESIYGGAFWTPASSLSYDGVIIMQPFGTEENTIRLGLGYPGPSFFTVEDPRADPRIMTALEDAGKLK